MKIVKILGFRRRQLHTIICREIIKPSSPTPSHLRTYDLSQLDKCSPHIYVPLVLFYPNNQSCSLTADDKARELKKSLSHSLTINHPFAGRLHTPTTPYIDCNDEGVVFVEAKNDSQMDKFQKITEDQGDNDMMDQLFADNMVWEKSPHTTSVVGVQLNHFACGGTAVAVSMSHRIGDGCTLSSLVNHWASVARYGSTDHKAVMSLNPHFIQSPTSTTSDSEIFLFDQICKKPVTRKFIFPNSKLTVLKNKILAASTPSLSLNKPTRVEVLTSLLFKTAVAAKSGSIKPSFLVMPMNMRNKFVPILPQTTVGNFVLYMMVTARHGQCETSLATVVSKIKEEKMDLEGVQSMQQACQKLTTFKSRLENEDIENLNNRTFWCSSLCGFPYNNVDFGWGNPTAARITFGSTEWTGCVLLDAPNADGIEAWVSLDEQEMEIFKNDKEMLSFCQN